MNTLDKIRFRLFGADPVSVAAYHTVLPRNIHVSLKRDKGYILARVDEVGEDSIKGLLITEAKDMDQLIKNVNDLIYTYVKMPENIRPYYGDVFIPENYKKNKEKLVLVKS